MLELNSHQNENQHNVPIKELVNELLYLLQRWVVTPTVPSVFDMF